MEQTSGLHGLRVLDSGLSGLYRQHIGSYSKIYICIYVYIYTYVYRNEEEHVELHGVQDFLPPQQCPNIKASCINGFRV